MQVRHALATAGRVTLACLVMLAFATLAIVGTNLGLRNLGLGMSAGSLRSASPAALLPPASEAPAVPLASEAPPSATPAEVLASRFPSEDAASQPSTFSTSTVLPGGAGETFDLSTFSGMATVEPRWPAADGMAPAAAESRDEPEPGRQPDSANPGGASPRRPSARSPNVLNDAQIANLKQRLKLTAEQARLWPAVEAALRKIVYTRTAMNPKGAGQSGGSPTAYIDPSSAEVQELKSAAVPLLMRLSDEQKREVKMLAYVMGLEAVASQF
jgi:hypothetical protein